MNIQSPCRSTLSWTVALLTASLFYPTSLAAAATDDPIKLTMKPASIVLTGKNARQQLLVTGHYSDGSVRDLTGKATFRTDAPGRVRLTGSVVHGVRDGKAQVIAAVSGREAAVMVTVHDAARVPPLRFRNDIMPIFSRAGCNLGTCHGNFNGKNGFRLSLRGENPAFDLDTLTRDTQGRRTCAFDPAASLLLKKATGQVLHEGGIRFQRDSQEYALLYRWIAGGLKADPEGIPHMTRLEVLPKERILLHGAKEQQLLARAHFSDGEVRDVTPFAVFDPNVPAVRVSPAGLTTTDKSTEVTVVVRYLDQQVPCRLAFVPDRPGFKWQDVPANNYIDKHVFARLKALQIQPSEVCDDPTFLRRVYLDVCGVLPTAAEVKAFLADTDPARRAKLIDRLLQRPEYADDWALKWADLLRNEEKAVDAKGVRHFQAWLRQCVGDDKPLDEFARELILARGSTYEEPAANYYRTNLDPQKAAETTASLFLGVRVACARCHNHPFDRWTQLDYHGLSAFFARVRTRIVDNKRRDKLDKHEFVGEMIVWLDRKGEVSDPQKGGPMPPRLPGLGEVKVGAETDRLAILARWLTAKENPYFARVMANRIWYHLLGRGIVEPVDDFRASNPPTNDPLLDELARDLVKSGFRQKHLIRTILNSRTYQLSSKATLTNADDEVNFSHVQPRLLAAEPLLDALSQVTEVPEVFKGMPKGTRAVQLPGVAFAPSFLKTFGRPDRLLACECERRSDTTLGQAFQMITGEAITSKVQESPLVARLLKEKAGPREIVTEFYLAALSRYPTARELDRIAQRLAKAADQRKAVEDLLWAILNAKEFLLRR
jgi:hypothetical protein